MQMMDSTVLMTIVADDTVTHFIINAITMNEAVCQIVIVTLAYIASTIFFVHLILKFHM